MSDEMLRVRYYFDVDRMGPAGPLFDGVEYAWDVVRRLQDGTILGEIVSFACQSGQSLDPQVASHESLVQGSLANVIAGGDVTILPGTTITPGANTVYIGAGARIGPNVHIDASKGSIYIGENVELRQGAYIREHSIICSGVVIGNSCEVKCSLIGPGAEVPHFNYVGDSALGHKAHLGAGAKLSNVKIAPASGGGTVMIRCDGKAHDTGLRKLGAIVGDGVQVGSNCVINPGTLIGPNAVIYPNSVVGGIVAAKTILKLRQSSESSDLEGDSP